MVGNTESKLALNRSAAEVLRLFSMLRSLLAFFVFNDFVFREFLIVGCAWTCSKISISVVSDAMQCSRWVWAQCFMMCVCLHVQYVPQLCIDKWVIDAVKYLHSHGLFLINMGGRNRRMGGQTERENVHNKLVSEWPYMHATQQDDISHCVFYCNDALRIAVTHQVGAPYSPLFL